MPGRDKTGPKGKGSGTGKGLGTCGSKTFTNESQDEQNNQTNERSFPGRGRLGIRSAGQGRRFRHRGGEEKQILNK